MHHLDAKKTAGEQASRQLHKNAASNIEKSRWQHPQSSNYTAPTSHHENYSG